MITFYYAVENKVNTFKDVPFEKAEACQFTFADLLQWSRIWARQSGEKVLVQYGSLSVSFVTI